MFLKFLKYCSAFTLVVLLVLNNAYSQNAPAEAKKPVILDTSYRLGAGDKVKLTVFGEEDLSGQFEVDGSGNLSLPLIGNMNVGGLDLRQVEQKIIDEFKDGYLVNPRVSLEVLNFRPFFILGEVNKPGSYPYVNGLTVINAVALAGGYTYRAKTGEVTIKREKDGSKAEIKAKENTPVLPGDTVQVEERFF